MSRIIKCFSPLSACMASTDTMGSSPQEGCFQVSFPSVPLQSPVSQMCGIFSNRVFPSGSEFQTPYLPSPHFLISHFLFPVFYYLPLQSSPGHGHSLVSHFSVVSSGYMLTSNDPKLGSTNQREHVDFVLLGLHYLTLYNIF